MKIKLDIVLIIFHLFIGVAISLFNPISKIYELALIATLFMMVYFKKDKQQAILISLAYVAGSEVFVKMSGGSISYELHKYLIIIFSLLGIFSKNGITKGYHYLFYMLLLFPAIFAGDYSLEDEVRKLVAFNLSGPICLGVVSFYLYKRKISLNEINKVLFYFLLPVISMSIYMHFFDASQYIVFNNTASNFATSGGFGPNQVATILGIASFILLTRLVFTFKFLDLKTGLNLFLFIFITYRSVLTFSRGGVFSAIIAAAFFLFLIYLYSNKKLKFRVVSLLAFFVVILVSIWTYTTIKTNGFINKRYAGENAAGVKKEDISSGRGTLIEYELAAFRESPILGIGIGKVKEYRYKNSGINAASHNEMTRLLAEHGLFGIFALLMIVSTPFLLRFNMRSNIFFYSFFLIWFLTINHSATRISAPAFIYGLCLLDIQYETNTIRRKQIKE